jgi:hypothetical protein
MIFEPPSASKSIVSRRRFEEELSLGCFEFFQELGWEPNLEALVAIKRPQVLVSGNHVVSPSRQRCFQKLVVIGIPRDARTVIVGDTRLARRSTPMSRSTSTLRMDFVCSRSARASTSVTSSMMAGEVKSWYR